MTAANQRAIASVGCKEGSPNPADCVMGVTGRSLLRRRQLDKPKPLGLVEGGGAMTTSKTVHVCAYVRTRNGHLEYVHSHWRSPPGQGELF